MVNVPVEMLESTVGEVRKSGVSSPTHGRRDKESIDIYLRLAVMFYDAPVAVEPELIPLQV